MEGKVFYIYKNIYKIKQLLPSSYPCGLKHQDTGVLVPCPAFGHREGDLMDQVDTIPCGGKNSKTWSRILAVKKKMQRGLRLLSIHYDSCVLLRLVNI